MATYRTPLRSLLSRKLDRLSQAKLEPVEVAVIDSGIDASHPDLQGRIVEAYAISTEEDGNVVISETSTRENNDFLGHGTAVASIIASVAPHVRITDIRVLNAQNMCKGDVLLRGFRFAVEKEIKLLNMSLAASSKYAPALIELCEKAYHQCQIVVASQKNLPIPDFGFPAEFSSCIAVGAESYPDAYSVCYRLNRVIDFGAQGEQIKVAKAGGGYTEQTGASFAAPTITGLTALLLGAQPDLRLFELKTILKALAVQHVN